MRPRLVATRTKINHQAHRARPSAILAACVIAALLGCPGSALALTIFTGADDAGPAEARPNSDFVRDGFFVAASAFGVIEVIDFESLATTDDLVVNLTLDVTATWTGITTLFDGTISDTSSQTLGYNTTAGGQRHAHIDPNSADARLTLDFSQPIVAWGAYVTGVGSEIGEVRVLLNDGTQRDVLLGTAPDGAVNYIGFTDLDNPIAQIVIASLNGDDSIGVDDMAFVIPEPSSMVFAIVGLPLLAVLAWRRRRPS